MDSLSLQAPLSLHFMVSLVLAALLHFCHGFSLNSDLLPWTHLTCNLFTQHVRVELWAAEDCLSRARSRAIEAADCGHQASLQPRNLLLSWECPRCGGSAVEATVAVPETGICSSLLPPELTCVPAPKECQPSPMGASPLPLHSRIPGGLQNQEGDDPGPPGGSGMSLWAMLKIKPRS